MSSKKDNSPTVDPTKIVECPLCLEIITPPIRQCEIGHSMCKSCFGVNQLTQCPVCRGPMTERRHVAFEQLLESVREKLQISCCYEQKGCKYNLTGDKLSHEKECRYRTFSCEGKAFAGWNCNWKGNYEGIEKHFKDCHKDKTTMQYSTNVTTKINFQNNYKDIHLISFFNGQAYFYYKHCVDVNKQKLYWVFQYVGLKSNAKNFFYEFEIYNGPVRKFKVAEICHNDTTRSEDIFEIENCVVMSFAAARNFLNADGELPFKFRIMKIKSTVGH